MPLRLRLPLRIVPHEESFGIVDAVGTNVCWTYFTATEERQQQTKRLSREDAVEVARVIARALTDRVEGEG